MTASMIFLARPRYPAVIRRAGARPDAVPIGHGSIRLLLILFRQRPRQGSGQFLTHPRRTRYCDNVINKDDDGRRRKPQCKGARPLSPALMQAYATQRLSNANKFRRTVTSFWGCGHVTRSAGYTRRRRRASGRNPRTTQWRSDTEDDEALPTGFNDASSFSDSDRAPVEVTELDRALADTLSHLRHAYTTQLDCTVRRAITLRPCIVDQVCHYAAIKRPTLLRRVAVALV